MPIGQFSHPTGSHIPSSSKGTDWRRSMENAAERVSKVDRLIKKEQSQADKKKVKWPGKRNVQLSS